ncbi:MAG: VOC family protein [Verrucomicrobiota bacterium]|nr:VOC family protein [Verrucomicrobiota bacterium]
MEPRISFITLGVRDFSRAVTFYRDTLKLPIKSQHEEVIFFEMGKTWLALYPRDLLAKDAGVPDEGSGFAGFTLAHNVSTIEQVDALLKEVSEAGGKIVKQGQKAFWGGYTGYFSDPDGFLWEVAWNPEFPHV